MLVKYGMRKPLQIPHALHEKVCRRPRGHGLVYIDDTSVQMMNYEKLNHYRFCGSRKLELLLNLFGVATRDDCALS